MKKILFILLGLAAMTLFACKNSTSSSYESSSSSSDSSSSTKPSGNQGLTNEKVETAVNSLVSDWRLSGKIQVRGIQEVPQQNAAIADLQFDNFEFGVSGTDELLRAKDFKPPKKSGQLIPSPEEMFPPKKITYSKQGKATLTKYNDGRWVLKQVNWHDGIACCGVKGNVEIR